MYKSAFRALRCPLLKWSTLESAARHTRSYLSYRFVQQFRYSLVLIQVSNESRRVGLVRLYLVNASICVSRKFQCCTFYLVLSMCSKVTHIINPHTYNTQRLFPSKCMYFRASTGRLTLTVELVIIILCDRPRENQAQCTGHQSEIQTIIVAWGDDYWFSLFGMDWQRNHSSTQKSAS